MISGKIAKELLPELLQGDGNSGVKVRLEVVAVLLCTVLYGTVRCAVVVTPCCTVASVYCTVLQLYWPSVLGVPCTACRCSHSGVNLSAESSID